MKNRSSREAETASRRAGMLFASVIILFIAAASNTIHHSQAASKERQGLTFEDRVNESLPEAAPRVVNAYVARTPERKDSPSRPPTRAAKAPRVINPARRRQTPVVTVSAASYGAEVAPDSIAAAFGNGLATQTVIATDADPNTPGIQLPTTLGGTTVEVNGRRAGLFFVSPTQVNYLIPAATEIGVATVVVRAENGVVSNGTARINAAAPAIFTASGSGQGPPAGMALRVRTDGTQVFEPLADFNPTTNTFVPRPINLGPEGERVFLILYLTGFARRG